MSNKTYLDHDGLKYLWSKIKQFLADKASADHTHDEYAAADHTHDEYAAASHEHLFDRGVTTEGTGAAYTATVEGITALTAGISFIMIPHTASTSQTATLNVNGLGAKQLRRPVSSNNTTTVANATTNWLYASRPVRVMYNGSFWIVMDMPRPHGPDIYGSVAIENGGTGATTAEAARTNLGLTTEEWTFTLEDGSTVTKAVYVG